MKTTSSTLHSDRFAFRDPASPEPVPSPQPQSPSLRSAQLASVPHSILVTLYSLVLMLLIVVYFTAVAALVFYLLDIEGKLVHDLWRIEGFWFVRVNLALLLLFPLTRLASHLGRGVWGLVTTRNDPPNDTSTGLLLAPADHPELYAAVALVGRQVGAPAPDEIRLGFRPECYAVEERSFAIRTDRKLVLVIGLPQVESLTLSELQVIIAHELSHFGAGDTRLGVFVYRFLETLRLAHEEQEGASWRWIDPVAWLSWAYCHFFLLLSTPIRRHQEFRADGWSAAAYGGEFAAQTLLKDWLVFKKFEELSAEFAQKMPRQANLFREFSLRFQPLTRMGEQYLAQRLAEEERPSIWDSHPTISERMANMRRYIDRNLPEPVPAYQLLHNLESIEQKAQEQFDAQQPAFPMNYLG